ncbi:MAG: PA2778 family cysteine peptidase [Gammaproteobacteria bacterium]|nr:PA2778 family cysteine peptidase [Gammaproteobacteria bacterium]
MQRNTWPESVELEQTPFFPQEDYQCGPAALATVLAYSGVDIAPNQLVEKVYIPGRRGSLQVELLAAARSLGRLPYVIEPEFGTLMAELVAGRPVLVLQNLGLSFAPVWHYAVVAGYDAGAEELILRSGTTERRVASAAKFARTWAASDNWAMVALRPGELPAVPVQLHYLQAVAALETVGQHEAAAAAFRAAAEYWPQSSSALFGLANAYYAAGDLVKAERGYRLALEREPDSPAVLNNLAQVLLEQGRCGDALEAISRALTAPEPHPDLQDALADSHATILRRCADDSSPKPTGT